jgi:hypothetical protein
MVCEASTVTVAKEEVLAAKLASPEYAAVIECAPGTNEVVL